MKVIVRGGVWRNSEDEILKAAVMKYGKNQWARIASLLHRKSAKQCKARWNEWLDPSIKKTEWSQEEDEKLLHMAKLMPTQWRTIAPIVGRTATQCLERYEHLLEKAQSSEMITPDNNKLKSEMVPETRPALPDAVDMDEDELEMLSEARARLANTQGKKAKRKAREKQLEENRRLSSLQRKRELKSAGIRYRDKALKNLSIDYNEEVPFEKKPTHGFFDTSEENYEAKEIKFGSVTTRDLDLKRRDIEEAELRKKDKEKLEKNKKEEKINTSDFILPKTKRSKLILPEPSVSNEELKDIFKIGKQNEEVQNYALSMAESEEMAQDSLMVSYDTNPLENKSLRTPMRTPMSQNSVIKEAQSQQLLNDQPTPLLAAKNPSKNNSQVDEAVKIKIPDSLNSNSQTPSSKRKLETTAKNNVNAFQTPITDRLGINTSLTPSITNNVSDTPMSTFSTSSLRDQKEQVKNLLSYIPNPLNQFEIDISAINGDNQSDELQNVEHEKSNFVVDKEDIEMENSEKEPLSKKNMVSFVASRHLPRPNEINNNVNISNTDEFLKAAEEMVKKRMLFLAYQDQMHVPIDVEYSKVMKSSLRKKEKDRCHEFIISYAENDEFLILDENLKREARCLIDQKCVEIKETTGHNNIPIENYEIVWDECYSQLMFLPNEKKFVRLAHATKKQILESQEWEWNQLYNLMSKESKDIEKIDKKVGIIHGGYINRASKICQEITQISNELDIATVELETYKNLLEHEISKAIPHRINPLKEMVEKQKQKGNELQAKYSELKKKLTEKGK